MVRTEKRITADWQDYFKGKCECSQCIILIVCYIIYSKMEIEAGKRGVFCASLRNHRAQGHGPLHSCRDGIALFGNRFGQRLARQL